MSLCGMMVGFIFKSVRYVSTAINAWIPSMFHLNNILTETNAIQLSLTQHVKGKSMDLSGSDQFLRTRMYI